MLQNIKISGKLSILTAFTSIIIVIFGVIAYYTVETTKINGNLYNEIALGKDLVADILPPPEFIIETYLITNELNNIKDQSNISNLFQKAEKLHQEFNDRHSFWINKLTDGELKKVFLVDSYDAAVEFYQIFESDFKRAVLANNTVKADSIFTNQLTPIYEKHKKAIYLAVKLTNAQNARKEKEANQIISSSIMTMIIIGVVSLILGLIFSIVISKSIVNPILQLNEITKKLAKGDFSFLDNK